MTADHPVAAQQVQKELCSARSCMYASDLRANSDRLMLLRMTPTLVTDVELIRDTVPEHKCDPSEALHDSAWMTVEVEQPQRYELLISVCDKSGGMIAVSSCDRKPDAWARGLADKNTFLNIQEKAGFAPERPQSAPPSLCRQRVSPAYIPEFTPQASEFTPQASTSHSTGHAHTPEDTSVTSSFSASGSFGSADCQIEPKVFVGNPNGKHTHDLTVNRLSDLMYWQRSGYPSQGSAHPQNSKFCRPCSFHFTHLRHPDEKPSCKMSHMCAFCHGCSKTAVYRSRFRKSRPFPKKEPLKVAL